jgi:hypothetical protein
MEVWGDIHVGLGSENRGLYVGPVGFTASFRYNGNGNLEIAPRAGYSTVFLSETTGTERARINQDGNMGIGTSSPTVRLQVNGGINYDISSVGSGGLNRNFIGTFNDNAANSISGGANTGFIIVTISQGNGVTSIPIFENAGGGIAWAMSVFDPDAGTFSYGAGPSVSFTTAGTGGNSYTLSVNGGSSAMTIQRTAGSSTYTVAVSFILG